MSLISQVIGRTAYEIILDRICQILADELEQQFLLSGDYDLQHISDKIYMERMVPFDYTELPALNVGIERGDYEAYHPGQSDAVYRYFIETNAGAVTTNDERGDQRAKVLRNKIMGKVRGILDHPAYFTLGFSPGQLIRHRHIESFVFAEPTRQDAENVTMARMILVVKTVEVSNLDEAELIGEWDTRVYLNESDKGYYWSKQTRIFDDTFDSSFE